MGATVLLVEDDDALRTSLRLLLEDEGHIVVEARSGEEGLERFAEGAPDVVVLDLTLPVMDGFEVCRELRRRSTVPILLLTARADSHDEVAGLEAGADDYVTKPAEPKVLSARIRTLLRRTRPEVPDGVLRVDDLEIDVDGGAARVAGNSLQLTKTEFLLLCELGRSAGKVLSRETLLERVWGHDFLGDSRQVDVAVRRLRAKIEQDPRRPERIVTVRGLGYRMEPTSTE